jgi:Flp pilus assembly protein TadG
MTSKRDRRTARRGAAVLEMAFVSGVFFYLMLGLFEYGHLVMVKQLMDNAAREGARVAIVSTNTYPVTTTSQIGTIVNGYLVGQPLNNVNIQVFEADPVTGANIGPWNTAPFGITIAVQIDADYPPMMPTTFGIIPSSIHLTSKSTMRSEAN